MHASATAEVANGIVGTVFPLVAAVGTPVIGCIDPALAIPDYMRTVRSAVLDDAGVAVQTVDQLEPLDEETLRAAVGPVGGSAQRLFDAWLRTVTPAA